MVNSSALSGTMRRMLGLNEFRHAPSITIHMSATVPLCFSDFATLLEPLDAVELHGLLCGLLCAAPGLDARRWLHHVASTFDAPSADQAATQHQGLIMLFEHTAAQLGSADTAISLLLPDDDTELPQRTAALSAWCQGLLYGLGLELQQTRANAHLSANSQEFLHDVAEIAHASIEATDASEDAESAYAEVVEYLRVGLLTIQQDLLDSIAPAAPRLH